jgi:hypothetical protein
MKVPLTITLAILLGYLLLVNNIGNAQEEDCWIETTSFDNMIIYGVFSSSTTEQKILNKPVVITGTITLDKCTNEVLGVSVDGNTIYKKEVLPEIIQSEQILESTSVFE